jgi:hypothetical protein
MSKAQNPTCTCEYTDLTVCLPTYLIEALTTRARHDGGPVGTVDALVESVLVRVENVIDPCILIL